MCAVLARLTIVKLKTHMLIFKANINTIPVSLNIINSLSYEVEYIIYITALEVDEMQQFLVLQHLWAQHCKEHPLILITSLRKSTDNVISNSRLSRRRVLNIFDTSTLLVVVVVYVVAVATDSGSC